ncbi:hypothetical protein PXK01_02980 [Phaeobacter sp. PT47_59]|uniref:hypothetical protein n=1 Tax=Phaeobacter sp. PT47_59 TaxID=3029979 RepID=UPI002380125C|nr:hypothetical protein [Phaeobacter sp. PT47_59]MDE4173100.1 hypothetical protein [Phaeobacter sp. PT47_59]
MQRVNMKWVARAAVLLAGLAGAAQADDPALSIELSTAEQVGEACLLSFVAQNSHAQDIAKAVFETVLFDENGQVARLTLLDFQDLPAGRMRVRQFQFPYACTGISRVLINGATTCEGGGLPEGACSRALTLTSRTDQELIG